MKVNLRVGSRVALVLMVFCSSLAARDLNQDEALALRQQGVILPLEQLLQQAMARYPARGCWRPNWKRNTGNTPMKWNW